ncbi:MAG: hypothetical protein H6Q75_1813 [Firmicutes bacterium]|nr:hypothetical protein [Bacillota bacterium]
MVVFHTMDLTVNVCDFHGKPVTLEKHYTQKAGQPETRKLHSVVCRNKKQCKNKTCLVK